MPAEVCAKENDMFKLEIKSNILVTLHSLGWAYRI